MLFRSPIKKLTVLCDSAVLYLSEDKVFCQILKADPEIFPMFPTVDPYEEINKRSFSILRNVLSDGVEKGLFVNMNVDKSAQVLFAIYKALIIEAYIQSDDDGYLDAYKETRNLLLYGIIKQ